jgi:23S rRNA (adenine2030-N6)-methyltransferase
VRSRGGIDLLSYRHSFHAGNLADVLKHSVLTTLLQAALNKPTPLLYVDTHAGAGDYDLPVSDRRAECHGGIGALRALGTTTLPPGIAAYLDCALPVNRAPARYSGSAVIASRLLRATDRLVLAERHPADYAALVRSLGTDHRVSIDPGDGYALLKSILPPTERRGIVLIDPAYELGDEPVRLIESLRAAFARFRHGVYLVWYPLQSKHDAKDLKRHFGKLDPPKTLCIELDPGAPAQPGAIASGVLIVNPPYQAGTQLAELTTFLGRNLLPYGKARCEWLVGE